tara:strand:- start:2295 stop:2843 length:549 start_codon:yes stop_codon:yes gene_type:complete
MVKNFTAKVMDDIKKRDKPNDKFYTPELLSKEIISLFDFKDNQIILDPCKGNGSFYNNYPDNTINEWCEIDDDKDFLKYNKRVDYVISNPPYSILNKFIDKCIEICDIGFGFLLHQHALTLPRFNKLEKNNFFLTKYHQCKIWEWYGHQVFVFFEKKPKNKLCCITYSKKYIKDKKKEINII